MFRLLTVTTPFLGSGIGWSGNPIEPRSMKPTSESILSGSSYFVRFTVTQFSSTFTTSTNELAVTHLRRGDWISALEYTGTRSSSALAMAGHRSQNQTCSHALIQALAPFFREDPLQRSIWSTPPD